MNNETISLDNLDDNSLKTSLCQLVTHICKLEEKVEHYRNEIEEYEVHTEQLEKDVENLVADNEKLKEKNEHLNRSLNDVNYVPWNSNYTEKAILEFIGNCPVKVFEKLLKNRSSPTGQSKDSS